MRTRAIQIRINDYKMIKQADVELKGITVISGPSHSGKSTLLNFIRVAFKFIIEFRENTHEETEINMEFLQFDLFDFLQSLGKGRVREVMKNPGEKYFLRRQSSLLQLVDRLESYCIHHLQATPDTLIHSFYTKELGSMLRTLQIRTSPDEITLAQFMDAIRDYIRGKYAQMEERLEKRQFSYLDDYYLFEIEELTWPESFEVRSGTKIIMNSKENTFQDFPDIKKVIYGYSDSYPGIDWKIPIAEVSTIHPLDKEIKELFHQVSGGVELVGLPRQHPPGEPVYASRIICRDKDGKLKPLIQLEKHQQNLLFLKLSLVAGRINRNTLVIIDNPDIAHGIYRLGQFARLACLLNKRYGVRFLISTGLDDIKQTFCDAALEYGLSNNFRLYEARLDGARKYLF